MAKALMDLHDVELAALAAAGGRREFGELVRRHGSAVRALLRRMGAQGAEADDVAQDAFLQAFEKCAEFRGEGTFAAWVKRIAARLYLKRKAKDARYVAELGTEEIAPMIDTPGRVDLDEALKALNETERLCVSLCHGAGLSHPEIATAMNLPLGTVKSHVKRGLDKLRARLSPDAAQSGRAAHVV
ncbi:MAG: sigma-70 family RNA polymerase sigma factor [Brevundimonas sp.]|uniref:RNA polymerase sigma factor n=1 Tax=Brevundimonas sp. TaxID=1871086 RepID=UPI002735B705|nr:sigma-70 family RNA polymerase sigma factor [Brevundimonas sp.]MBX9614661.1 sigma-70 family RNA polymerase sigma factor [Caulobacteraceae bacterium]MDP3403083.1 sigma-70 family RNA polymerase sigma factor [Brevundimonas sp.]